MSELLGERREKLKEIIRRLHRGEDPEKIKAQFKEIVKGVSAEEVAMVEQELVNEGIPPWEIQKLCEAHLQVFRDSLKEETDLPEHHPIAVLMEEHRVFIKMVQNLLEVAENLPNSRGKVKELLGQMKESESHYLREENVLFPYLEKHGVVQPPKIMWMEHDQIRALKKEIYQLAEQEDFPSSPQLHGRFRLLASRLLDTLASHFFKENKILFPTALKLITREEWGKIRKGFDEIGYCCVHPEEHHHASHPEEVDLEKDVIELPTGELTLKELMGILNTLPVDITFIDREDTVKYFNQPAERIFLRTEAVIGRKVQLCHPQKSVHVVNRILEEFKSGKRDVAEFWIEFQGRFVHIRYFPVRDREGNYVGCLEVTQDVTHVRELEGEKRLLD